MADSARSRLALLDSIQRPLDVLPARKHREHRSVRDFTGQLQSLRAHSPQQDRRRRAGEIQLDPVQVEDFSPHGDHVPGEKSAGNLDPFSHDAQRGGVVESHLSHPYRNASADSGQDAVP